MEHVDRFGLELTTKSSPAVEDYVVAVDLLLSANAGAEALLDRALAADPDFAAAHIAKSLGPFGIITGEQLFDPSLAKRRRLRYLRDGVTTCQ